MRCPGDSLGQFLLPLCARAVEGRDMLPLRLGDLPVQAGQFGDRSVQQRTTIITATGMFDVGKRLVGWGQATGNLTPHRRARTIALAQCRLGRSHALQLAIQQRQPLKLLPASRTDGKMRVHIRRVQHGFRTPARFLEQFRQFRRSDMLVGIYFQN